MSSKTYYICKYTPVEIIEALGGTPENLNAMRDGFDQADLALGANICGFGKTVVEAVFDGEVKELVLVNCCDAIKSVYDVLEDSGKLDFLYLFDILHADGPCAREWMAAQIKEFAQAYAAYKGTTLNEAALRAAFHEPEHVSGPHISIMGARMGDALFDMVQQSMPYAVDNMTCVNNRSVGEVLPPSAEELAQLYPEVDAIAQDVAGAAGAGALPGMEGTGAGEESTHGEADARDKRDVAAQDESSLERLFAWYAAELLGQFPCMRMVDVQGRRRVLEDPNLKGIVYHTVRFCDFYGPEYAQIKDSATVPLVKIESDYTTQSAGQLLTRLEAFAESLESADAQKAFESKDDVMAGTWRNGEARVGGTQVGEVQADSAQLSKAQTGKTQPAVIQEHAAQDYQQAQNKHYYAGIDSGSTSTDVVILDDSGQIVSTLIMPTGAGASASADVALNKACEQAGISREDIARLVTTGYGRAVIEAGDKSVTEITCHAKGVHYIDPSIRCIVDIGGQDSKAISLDADGNVVNFTMNDKCAAGTGRFLDMMARTMEMDLDQMSQRGLSYKEDITISSMCSVFAESEVVSLIAQNKAVDDIVHGLNKSVAVKTKGLVKRVNGQPPFMMTGGVSRNTGLVKELEEKLEAPLVVSEYAQLCGALGAALLARE